MSELDHLGLFTGIIRDITAMKALQRQVLEAAAEEDRRIGQELHDNTQQQLTGLGLLATSLAEALESEAPEQAKRAARLADGIGESARHVSLLARGLIPVEVEAQGLRAALADLSARVSEQCGKQCSFRCQGDTDIASSFTATHLYRICQEAITNAMKHSRLSHLEVILNGDDDEVTVTVLDDGVGIGNAGNSDMGMGLEIMRYRAGLIGGTVQIQPRHDRGTAVSCTVRRKGNLLC